MKNGVGAKISRIRNTVLLCSPDTHVGESEHDVVLHGRVGAGVQQLSEGGDDPLGLALVLQAHLAQAHHSQGAQPQGGNKPAPHSLEQG